MEIRGNSENQCPVEPIMELGVAPMEPQTFWIENLRRYQTIDQLKQSAFFARHGEQIQSYLGTAQVHGCEKATPRLSSFLRIAQWNIEKGKRFKPILDRLQKDEILKWADVLILNEADRGMNRTENRHVARDLAEALGMHMVFGPAHFELTKGTEAELFLEGENRESLQGNAVLSRYPVSESLVLPLPVSFEPYEFSEKRFGRRTCLWVRLQLKSSCLWVGSVHLELRNTPQCRARQIEHILKHLPAGGKEPCLLAGDLNTNSFARGTPWRTLGSLARLLFRSPALMKEDLLHPESGREPLFRLLHNSGFNWEGLNSSEETARAAIDSLEESGFLSGSILKLVRKRLDPYQGYFCFKLDWIVGKGFPVLSRGQKQDSRTKIISLDPASIRSENSGPGRVSDHLPIYADIDLA